MTLVTIAASYGAGGSRIAPELAGRLDVPFLGRPSVPGPGTAGAEADCANEGFEPGRSGLLSRLASMAVAWGTPAGMTAEELLPDEARHRALEAEVQAFAERGSGVILGRGAAVLLHGDPRALHVFLDGPEEERVVQAMEIEAIDRRTAQQRLERTDRFRRAYVEELYGMNVREPGVFHLVLDSTAIPLEDCVELIAGAARRRGPGRGRPRGRSE
jgi:cytidylate kinase